MLGALEGAAPDPNDPATSTCTPPPGRDYTAFLDADALRGARIGIPRAGYYESIVGPDSIGRGGLPPAGQRAMDDVIALLRARGAVIVDPANLPSVVERDPARNALLWGVCSGLPARRGFDADCSIVFKYAMRAGRHPPTDRNLDRGTGSARRNHRESDSVLQA
jgi:amidase